ncbi:B12-binding domain-containing protein [Tundrisphaera lichenicola]|uniref:B12-binding domain-containing protein n=1 Tax=Tundrisphaera lichenicola TaxID=2029860 RepID=UPI003EC13DAD
MTTAETYLKVRQVAEALGVSVSTIQRLVDGGSIQANRTIGRHRRLLLSSVLDYARRERYPVDRLHRFENNPTLTVESCDESSVDRLVDLLRSGKKREATILINSVIDSGRSAVELADNLIRPVMEEIGHGWERGAWDVYQEHQATQVVISALMGLVHRSTSSGKAEGQPLALVASAEGDPYIMPGLLGELVLREVGWEVRNLGVNLPLKSLARAARDQRPALVFLSAGHLPDPAYFLQEYSHLYKSTSSVGAPIILGGRALDPDLRSRLIFASFGDRMAHLAEFARTLLPAISASRPLVRN